MTPKKGATDFFYCDGEFDMFAKIAITFKQRFLQVNNLFCYLHMCIVAMKESYIVLSIIKDPLLMLGIKCFRIGVHVRLN